MLFRRRVVCTAILGIFSVVVACGSDDSPGDRSGGPESGKDGGVLDASGDGATGDGATSDGATSDGATGDGATGDGATGDGATGDGATGDGALPPSCFDSVKNGTETDLDCGGDCLPCAAGQHCKVPADCETGNCAGGNCGP